MKKLNFFQKSAHAIACIGCIALCSAAGSATETESSNSTIEDSSIKTRIEVTASGDTVIHYYYEPFDFGALYKSNGNQKVNVASNNVRRSSSSQHGGNTNITVGTVNTENHVGKIAFSEAVTPTGGKTVSVPVMSAKVPGSAPQVALVYNSQGGNSVAGYGWGISGLSAITLTDRNHYYDGKVEASDLYKPDECVFALNGTRLVAASESNIPDYQYVTSQGFIYVKKILSGNHVAYFEVLYPDGGKATFGFKDNTSTQLSYPVTSIVDIKGYRVDFEYTSSGNNYYIKSIKYGGKGTAQHAEITFEYEDRTDFTTVYAYGQAIASSKLLKKIVSKSDSQELRTYTLSHEMADNVNRLTKIDCSAGTSHLNPLTFAYNYYSEGESEGELYEESAAFVSEYFKNSPDNKIQYVRGKLLKDSYGDGMIIYPGKFSTYGLKRTCKVLGVVRAMEYGSLYPADQEILIIPNVRFWNNPISIVAEAGFQSINATDINGDGVDEVVKVNFNGLDGSKTILKITVYSFTSDNSYQTRTFNVKVEGCINSNDHFYSPVSRDYYWGNFNGDGKNKLLTISHNKTFKDQNKIIDSYFALIDLSNQTLSTEKVLFSYPTDGLKYTLTIDMDGDGKSELSHAVSDKLRMFKFSNNTFTEVESYANFGISQFNQTHYITDLNGDGKIDFLYPPTFSYQKVEYTNIPVWAPQFCPECFEEYPIISQTDFDCRYCGFHIGEPTLNSDSKNCIECNSSLKWYNTNPDELWGDKKLGCPFDGFSVSRLIDFGYVDNGNEWTVYLNTGKGFLKTHQNISNYELSDKFTFIDVNKDGLADMIKVHKSEAELYLNKNGVLSSAPCGNPIAMQEGLSDFMAMNISNPLLEGSVICVKDSHIYAYDFSQDASKANLLTSITDSHGVQYSVEYIDMTEAWNHVKSETPRYYPYAQAMFPLNLVSNTRVTLPGSYKAVSNINYMYKGAVMHMQGLGFCGFEKSTTYDVLKQIHSEEIRNPEMQGVTTKVTSPVKEVTYAYSRNKRSNGQENIQVTRSTELDKLTQVSTSTYYQYDSYGNPTCVTQNVGSNLQSITTQSYRNTLSSERFLAGLPLVKTVKRSRTYSVSSDIEWEYAEGSTETPEAEAGTAEESNGSRRRTSMEIIPPVETDSVIDETSVTETWIDREEITYDSDSYLPIVKKTYTGADGSKKVGEIRWTYDSNGNVTSEKSAPFDVTEFLGTTYIYDADGRNLVSSTDALGQTVTYSNFDKYGNARTVTDHKGRVSTVTYDEWGAQVSSTSPSGLAESVTTAWGGKGLYTITKTATGKPATIVHYDAAGREIRKGNQRFDGKWQYVDNAYDSKGRLEKVSLPFKGSEPTYWNSYSYDEYSRPVQITEASGKVSAWSYNGLSVTETKNGITSTKTSDESGALASVTDEGGVITYRLRPDGQHSSITAPGGVKTEFEYDEYGRQTAINDPSAGRQTYAVSYDSDGSKTSSVTDANGKTVTTKSDKYGRVISITQPEFNTAYTYNADGRLTKEASTNGTSVEYTYDSYDRPLTVKETGLNGIWLKKTFSYADGNVASVKYENQRGVIGTEQFTYTNGHNTEITLNGTIPVWKLTAENDLGQPTESVTGSLTRTYGYTEFGMPTQRMAGSIQDFSYDFDVTTGNLNSRADNTRGLTESFSYDALNRLVGIGDKAIEYADNGNIMSMPGVGALSYDIADRPYQVSMLTPEGVAVPLRDQSVTYTSFKRPNTIEEDGVKATFTYNATGDRVKMLVEKNNQILLSRHYIGKQYEYDAKEFSTSRPTPGEWVEPISPVTPPIHTGGGVPVVEEDGIMPFGLDFPTVQGPDYGTHRLYLGGDAYSAPAVYVNESGTWRLYFICRDYLGSITHIANSDGTLKAEYSYDAWGRLRDPETQEVYEPGSEPTLFLGRGYTGHEHLPRFGLINMNARLYDPALGRFMAPDPYVQAPDFTQNFNRYSYCMNNPLKFSDPNGKFLISTIVAVTIGATIGGITGGIIGYMNGARGWNLVAHIGLGALIGGASVAGGALISSVAGSGVYAMGAIGATSGAIAGAGFGALSSGGDWDSIGKGALNGAIGGFLGGALGSAIGGGWGAFSGGAVASGVNYAANSEGIDNINWRDLGLTMLSGGLISYGTYELATYISWKQGGHTMGNKSFSYRQYRTIQADIQRSRTLEKEFGGFLKEGQVKRFPAKWRYSHGISSDNSGTIPLDLDAEAMYHTHWDRSGRNVLLNSKGDQYFQSNENVSLHKTTLYHSSDDFLPIDSYVINRYNYSFNPANSSIMQICCDNFIRYSPFYYFIIK